MADSDGLGADPPSERCPSCGSVNICQQTESDTRKPYGCLSCDLEFESPTRLQPHEIPTTGDPSLERYEREHL